MKIRKILLYSLMMLTFSFCSKKKNPPPVYYPTTPVDKGWTFETIPTWADEFDYTGAPDPAKWGYDIGGSGWGNNELQYYTNSTNNASVGDGVLTITAKKESFGGKNYTSSRMISKGGGDFLYGRIEIKAKLPAGKGTWPALWMLPTEWAYGDWPKSGEIDIMEHVGYDLNKVHISVHTELYNHRLGTQKSNSRMVENATTAFHLYRVDWTPFAVRGYIDDVLIFQHTNEGKGAAAWPFDKKFHLLLNVAVGGDWGGAQGIDETVFPAKMEVDFVRLFKMIDK